VIAKKFEMNKSECRRYRRIALDLPARITVNTIDEYPGRLLNMSPGDMALQAEGGFAIGDAAVVHIKKLDIIEGRIARVLPDGFALSFRLSRSRRAALTERLMLLANPDFAADLTDRRVTPRHGTGDQRMVCRLQDGSSLFVRVLDQSVDGIAVESKRKPPVGTPIHVGRAKGVIMRHTPRGFVVVYELEPAAPAVKLRAV